MTVRDSINRTGARTPGAEDYPTSMAAHGRAPIPTQCGITAVVSTCAKGRHKPNISRCMPGAGLSRLVRGKVLLYMPAFQPYRGKPAVRKCVQKKTGVFSRRQACRGKSQAPCSLDSRVAGNQNPEAYRQGLPWGDHESPGRNDSERKCGLERPDPRAEPASVGRRQNGVPKSDRCGIATSAG